MQTQPVFSIGATNAKNPPIKNITTAMIYIRSAARRVRMQVAAKEVSIGHGNDRARHCITPEITNIIVAVKNTSVLCSENQTNCGILETSDDKAAPAPIATSNAGNAQQIKVPLLVKSEIIDAIRVFFKVYISGVIIANSSPLML